MAQSPFGVPLVSDTHAQLVALVGGKGADKLLEALGARFEAYDEVPWDELAEGGLGKYAHHVLEPDERPAAGYQGLIGDEYKRNLKKGYVDLGMVNPRATGVRLLNPTLIAQGIVRVQKGDTSFIRDPEGVLRKSGITPKVLGDAVRDWYLSIIEDWDEDGSPERIDVAQKARAAIKAQRVVFQKVEGRTGAGYRVIVRPTMAAIMKKLGMGEAAEPEGELVTEVRDQDGNIIKKGDIVGFKAGTELTGKVVKIRGKQITVKSLDREGFDGGYAAGQEYYDVMADEVWKEDEVAPSKPSREPKRELVFTAKKELMFSEPYIHRGWRMDSRGAKVAGRDLMRWVKREVQGGRLPRQDADYPNSLGIHLLKGRSDLAVRLIRKHGDKLKMVDKELIKAIQGWEAKGESVNSGDGLLDEAARTWSANGYLEIKTAERLTPKDVKAIKRYVLRWANGGERAGPSMLPKGARWKATDVALTGGKLMIAFETDAEPTRRTVNNIEAEVIGGDGMGGMLWQFAVHDASSDDLQMALYGGYQQADDPMHPLRVVAMDISPNVGFTEDMDEALAIAQGRLAYHDYDVPSPGQVGPKPKRKRYKVADKWHRGYLDMVKRSQGVSTLEPIEAYMRGVWAVHKGASGWQTSHGPSGMGAWSGFASKADAQKALDLILKEWPFMLKVGRNAEPGEPTSFLTQITPHLRDMDKIVAMVKRRQMEDEDPLADLKLKALEEAKVRRARKVKAKKARKRAKRVAAGVQPDKPNKVYSAVVPIDDGENWWDRKLTYKLPMAGSGAPADAERALLVVSDDVDDGAQDEIVGYLGRPETERHRAGGFAEKGYGNTPNWTAYDTSGRVVLSGMMFADAVSDLLLHYNTEIEEYYQGLRGRKSPMGLKAVSR